MQAVTHKRRRGRPIGARLQGRGPAELKIGVREKTMRKFKQVAKRRGLSIVETADACVDAFIEKLKAEEVVLTSGAGQG